MCNKGNTQKSFVNCAILILLHMCDLVHSLPVGILQFYINWSMWSHFRNFFSFKSIVWGSKRMHSYKKGIWLVAWSQSVRMPHQWPYYKVMDPLWIVRIKSTRIFIPKTIVIYDTSIISVNVRVLLNDIFLSWY